RFRFLNGSNARVYQLFLSPTPPGSNPPFIAIGTDSHLLDHPVPVQSFRIAPAERVEVVIDFSKFSSSVTQVFLVNRLQQTDGRKPDGLVSPGTKILRFDLGAPVADPSQVPTTLRHVVDGPQQLLPRVVARRTFEFERSDGAWVINGRF